MLEPRPCPKCAVRPSAISKFPGDHWWIECPQCGTSGKMGLDVEHAIRLWNIDLDALREEERKHPPAPAEAIARECDAIRDMLLDKNRRYGNAALEPLGIAAKGLSPEAGIRIRIDDKLKRWQTLPEGDDEDTVADLIGYLILLRVARGRK